MSYFSDQMIRANEAGLTNQQAIKQLEHITEQTNKLANQPTKPAVKYLLSEWEENGYHDSDFMAAVWNTETQAVESELIGTTRFAGGIDYSGIARGKIPSDILTQAVQWLEDAIFNKLKKIESDRVYKPNDIKIGDSVKLTKNHRNHAKEIKSENCRKCNGSGKWINPRNQDDKRDCFSCNGNGTHKKAVKLPKVNGKQTWDTFEAGITGKVIWSGTFRQIYKKGYNKLDRSTISTKVELTDGRVMNAPLKKLQLDETPLLDKTLRQQAESLSYNCKFGAVLSSRYAWDSKNPAYNQLNSR
jgi:hypothetical protein